MTRDGNEREDLAPNRSVLRCGLFGTLVMAIALASTCASAEDAYPSKPVRIIVSFAAGGPTDIVARVIGARMGELLGQQFVVENRTGAGGNIGADAVAKSAPDGYTVYLGFQGTQSVLPHVDPKLPYDPGRDFAPVVLIAMGPAVLVVNPSFPARTIKELIELAKAKPGAYSYASGRRRDHGRGRQ